MGRLRAATLARAPDVGEVVLAGGDAGRTQAAADATAPARRRCRRRWRAAPTGSSWLRRPRSTASTSRPAPAWAGPVLCEKPVALTVRDTQATVDLLREAGVPVQIGFQRRFDPALRAARDQAASGGLGTLASLRISAHDAQPPAEHFIPTSGGIFRDMHVHDFDLARWLTGREVATAFAAGPCAARALRTPRRRGHIGGRPDDGRRDARRRRWRAASPARVRRAARAPWLARRGGGRGLRRPGRGRRSRSLRGRLRRRDGGVRRARARRGDSACPPEAALEALRVAEACDRSRAEGRPVAV